MAPLKPIGFWSYTSKDDAASDGRLSQLRRLLANQLQAHVGRGEVHIFQDVTAIPPGTEWERQIDQALEQASFFIPIMTPGFVQSEWCSKEVVQFRAIMERRGRTDLIVPIHYLDVDAFGTVRHAECFDPEGLAYLRTLQWVDFRPLRLRDPTSEDVRQALDAVAMGIVNALYRDNRLPERVAPQQPVVSPVSPPIPSTDASGPATDPAASGDGSEQGKQLGPPIRIWKRPPLWVAAGVAVVAIGLFGIRAELSQLPERVATASPQAMAPPGASTRSQEVPLTLRPVTNGPTPTPAGAGAVSSEMPHGVASVSPKELRDICPTGVICPDLVLINHGSFDMGATPEEQDREKVPDVDRARERPKHQVNIGHDFYMAKYAVTVAEFRTFARAKALKPTGGCLSFERNAVGKIEWQGEPDRTWEDPGFAQSDRDPVVCVSYDDAVAYIDWLNMVTGARSYRLPSETEWEYAARAGTVTARFWGDGRSDACRFANASDQALAKQWDITAPDPRKFFACDDGFPFTAPIGSFQPNKFGLFDMLGNVWQWTSDCWSEDYKDAPTDGSARTAANCGLHSVRGGSWGDYPWSIRSASRFRNPNGARDTGTGFRLAKSP